MSNTDSFGYWLRRRRMALDMTQCELAHQVPCSVATIKKIESDARRPSPQMAERLAICLGLAPHEQTLFLAVARGARPVSVLDLADTPLDRQTAIDHIPVVLTPFIGRQTEMAAITALLASADVRMITILGLGGMGKTRLAIAVAEAQRDLRLRPFSDGIVFVDLVTTSAAEFIIPTIANNLGLDLAQRRGDNRTPQQKLLDFIGPRRMLLILDNYEHLLKDASTNVLTVLLEAAPHLKLLITSRLRLNLREEHLFTLSGLFQAAAAGQTNDPESSENAASQLFLSSARRVRPDFFLAPGESEVLATICEMVECMPLALELASAWVDSLSLAGIASEIASGFDILSSDLSNLPERHRSMRGTIDATWRLLEPSERQTFMRLSVFCGGFDKEAAVRVAGASLPTLSRLIGKSLVDFQPNTARYRIHEVLRQYGEEKLAETQSLAATQRRHFAYFLDMATTAHANLFGSAQIIWLQRLQAELDNFRTALDWGLTRSETRSDTANLVISLSWFWRIHSHVLEAGDWLDKMIHQPGLNTGQRAGLLYHAGHFAWMQGDFELARQREEQSLALWKELGAAGNQGAAYTTASLGMALYGSETQAQTDLSSALATFETSLALFHAVGDDWGVAFTLKWLAFTLTARHEYESATAAAQASLVLFERLGEAWGRGLIMGALAGLSLQAGDLKQARSYAETALDWRIRVGHRHSVAVGYEVLATIAEREKNLIEAAASYRHAIAIFDSLGNKPYADKMRERLAALLVQD